MMSAHGHHDPSYWHVQCQFDPPAWVAVRHPTPTGIHVVVAYDLADLEAKLAAAELEQDSRS